MKGCVQGGCIVFMQREQKETIEGWVEGGVSKVIKQECAES